MLIIKTKVKLVCIPDNVPYMIYTDDYLLDKEGNRKDPHDEDSLKCYDYGDLCIETESVTYRFKNIYAAYEWVELLNDKIAEAYAGGSKNAVIDMASLEVIAGEEFIAPLSAEYRYEIDEDEVWGDDDELPSCFQNSDEEE